MRARHPVNSLIPYLRGALEAAERDQIRGHLEQCGECRRTADELVSGLKLIADRLEEMPAPVWSEYWPELRRKLAARNEVQRGWWRPAYGWTGVIAAGIAALIIFMLAPRPETGFQMRMPSADQLALADTDVDMLRNYQMVERMDLLENYDVIEHLDELKPAGAQPDEIKHL